MGDYEKHVDGYRLGVFDQPPYPLIRRWDDPGTFPSHVRMTGESYWNGYVFYTAPHADGECQAHNPGNQDKPNG